MHNWIKKLTAALIGIIVALTILEIGCQALFAVLVAPQLKSQQEDQLHYYIPSDNPALSYQMKPNYSIQLPDRRLAINSFGFREDTDRTDFQNIIALFGDSVPFGQGVDQTETPTAELQKLIGDSTKVLNFGTCGYGLEELVVYLKTKYEVYQPQTIYYFLNLNDFSRRNTIYEGGDNGLYRIYKKPGLKLPFFIRKAVYRFVKEGKMSSVKWYKWMFDGNKDKLLPLITNMSEFAKGKGNNFKVVLFPPGVGYENGTFALQEVFDEIITFCQQQGIQVIAPVDEFGNNPDELQDPTDHFTTAGSKVMAKVIYQDWIGG